MRVFIAFLIALAFDVAATFGIFWGIDAIGGSLDLTWTNFVIVMSVKMLFGFVNGFCSQLVKGIL